MQIQEPEEMSPLLKSGFRLNHINRIDNSCSVITKRSKLARFKSHATSIEVITILIGIVIVWYILLFLD